MALRKPALNNIPSLALRLRVIILTLGEASTPKWWRTQYLSGAGLRILERVYPRTAFAAAVRADTIAACALHDAGTGRGGVYHLFRLPVDIEQEVHRLLTGKGGKMVTEDITSLMGDMNGLTNVLRDMAVEVPGKIVGPWRAGNKPDLQGPEIYGRLAGAYLRTIETGEKIYPYVEAEKSH